MQVSKSRLFTLASLAVLSALPAHAETFYLFSSDRGNGPQNGSGIHRYSFESENPGKLIAAPSAGQPGDIWGESAGRPIFGQRSNGVAIGANGDVYVAYADLGAVYRFDGQSGAYKGEVVRGLDKPDGLAFGPDGNLYIASGRKVVRYSAEGKPMPAAGQRGSVFADSSLEVAAGLTFGPDGHLYVASQGTSQIVRFDGKSGRFLGVFSDAGISAPSEIGFGPDGHLYVASTGGPSFNAESGFIARFDGVTGQPLAPLTRNAKGALGLEFGPKSSVFASSYWGGRITKYDSATGKTVGEAAAGSTQYYLTLAKRVSAEDSRVQPWAVKVPRLSKNDPRTMKPSPLNLGAATVKGWKNALKPSGTPGPQLTLADNKRSAYSIVLPANPTTMDQKAAAMLSWTLQEMTGADFRVVQEGGGKLGHKAISIGRTKILQAAQLKEASLDLGDEGYAIAAKGSNLFLLGGKTRGAIYAVLALLEEDLGCRWYAPKKSGVRIPRVTKLSFKPGLRHFVPVLPIRDPYYYDAFNGEWSLNNKTNSPSASIPAEYGGHAKHALFVHTYNRLVPPEEYFASHPEYFGLVNGKRQPYQLDLSNPDVFRITVENVKKFLRAEPDSKFISVSANDGRGYCECPQCSAVDAAEATIPGSKTGSLIKFVNKVAAAIEPEFPHVKVTTLAYLDTFTPPKTLRPRKNVVIQLCTDSHAWKYQFCRITESEAFQKAMKDWHAIGADMYIWDYTADFVHSLVPFPNMPVVRDNIKFYMDHGAKGVMLQGVYNSFGADMARMRVWVWAKQLWDPSLDTRALMRDFIFGYYGDAAEPIWNYNMTLWRMWEDNHKIPHVLNDKKPTPNPLLINDSPCSAPPDWALMSPEFLEQATRYFEQAENLAKDPETRQRVQEAKISLVYVKLGQGLGYIPEMGDYVPGSWVKTSDPARKAYCENLLKEFIQISTDTPVVAISERSTTPVIIDKWRDILAFDPTKISVLKLDNNWKFKTDPDRTGLAQGFPSAGLNDGDWSVVRSDIAKGWESQGFADFRGEAWYRQKLFVPAGFNARKHLTLFFGAVDSESEIYINGEKVFEHTLASTGLKPETIWNDPFAFDPTKWLKPGEENTIAVKVSSWGGIRGIWTSAFLYSSDEKLSVPDMVNAAIVLGK